MATLRNLALVTLILSSGCSDATSDSKPQAWESGKKQLAAEKPTTSEKSEKATPSERSPKEPAEAQGAFNPHGSMPSMTAGQNGPAVAIENDGKLDIETAHWKVAKTWIRKQPSFEMIKAEYGLPKVEGDPADGRLTVTFASGGVDKNIDRWKGQFEKLDKEGKESLDVGGVKVSLVDLSGTFLDGGMMGPKTSRPNYRMIGAVYEIGDLLLFAKCYGPAKTMAARADEIKDFVRSYKADK